MRPLPRPDVPALALVRSAGVVDMREVHGHE
jgi:hypothetical protein